MKKMLQFVHMLQLLKHVSLTSTKSKTPSTPTVTEQPIRWAVKNVCGLTLETVTRPRTPVLWNGTALELRYQHRGFELVFFQRCPAGLAGDGFLGTGKRLRRSPGSWQNHPLFLRRRSASRQRFREHLPLRDFNG